MKNYASRRANKGKTAYRTPSVFKYQASLRSKKHQSGTKTKNPHC